MRRRTLIVIVVLAALLIAADVVARRATEAGVARELARSVQMGSSPQVSIAGIPFIPHLVAGRFPEVTIDARDVRQGGVTLTRVHAVLRSVRAPAWSLARGHGGTVTADSGTGTATISAADAGSLLRAKGIDGDVTFSGGQAHVHIPAVGLTVTLGIDVGPRSLVLRAPGLPGSVSFDLPTPITGLRYTGARVVGDALVLAFAMEHPSFTVSG